MIASAIGKLTAKVPTRVRANSESKVGSGRICSNDMRLTPSLQIAKNANHGFPTYARKVPQPPCRLRPNG